jgi:cytosine/creatinine deaminase
LKQSGCGRRQIELDLGRLAAEIEQRHEETGDQDADGIEPAEKGNDDRCVAVAGGRGGEQLAQRPRPGTADLMDQAITHGADLVGGLDPGGFDQSIEGHLDVVFGIAERRGVGIDIHLHDPGALGISELEDIAKRTKALGMQGRVAVSHAYALGQVPIDTTKRVARNLADCGVAIMTNAPGDRAFPPINVLREAGVLVFSGSDNVRDAWWPYGDADMIERAMIVGYCSGFYTDEEIRFAFDMVSVNGSAAMRIPDYGIRYGGLANFVALPAHHVQEAIMARPRERSVYRAGKLIAQNGEIYRT